MMQVWPENTTLRVIGATVLASALSTAALAEGINATSRAVGAEHQRGAVGWLRLESEQRRERDLAAPLGPSESQRLQVLEQQERARYREHLQTQERELRILSHQGRSLGGEIPGGPSPMGRLRARLLEQQRIQRGLELRRQMDRRGQDASPRRPLTPQLPASRTRQGASPP